MANGTQMRWKIKEVRYYLTILIGSLKELVLWEHSASVEDVRWYMWDSCVLLKDTTQ